MEAPCKNCQTRKMYARIFDAQIWGEDCPYDCEKYERWKETQNEKPREDRMDRSDH